MEWSKIVTAHFQAYSGAPDTRCKLMVIFRCNLPIARCYKQFLEGTTAFATSGRTFTCNGIVATDYLQWFTCNAIFHSIEIMIAADNDIQCKLFENPIKIG